MILKEIGDFNPSRHVAGIQIEYQDQILKLFRQENCEQGGKWSYVGGTIEKDETVLEGAVRETKEETQITITPEQLALIDVYPCRVNCNDFYLHLFRTRLDTLPKIKLNTRESSKYGWFSLEGAFELDLIEGGQTFLEDANRFSFY